MKPKASSSVAYIALASAVSGALSGYFLLPPSGKDTFNLELIFNVGLLYGPGIFFGIIIGALCLWLYRGRRKWAAPLVLVWAVASVVAWRIALQIALSHFGFSTASDSEIGSLSYTIAGLVGSFILSAAFWLLIKRIHPARLLLAIGAGAVLGFAMSYIISGDNPGYNGLGVTKLIAAFMLWQIGVALALVEPPRDA